MILFFIPPPSPLGGLGRISKIINPISGFRSNLKSLWASSFCFVVSKLSSNFLFLSLFASELVCIKYFTNAQKKSDVSFSYWTRIGLMSRSPNFTLLDSGLKVQFEIRHQTQLLYLRAPFLSHQPEYVSDARHKAIHDN